MITDLTWDNYLEFNNFIKTHNFKDCFISAVNLVSWVFYGINFKFHIIDDNHAVLYIDYHFNAQEVEHSKTEFWYVSACFYNEHSDLEIIKETIINDLKVLNTDPNPHYAYITKEMMDDLKIESTTQVHSFVSNYIYDLEKMRTFAGRKLQKKRNHINAFVSQNHNYKLVDIKQVPIEDLFVYLDKHMQKYAEIYRDYEIDVYRQYLGHEVKKDKNYFGTVIYINDEIVALTLCYLHPQVCEVLIEKAEHNIRGLYQFLIKENLLFHNISVAYMDRQDDMDLETLAKSKRSYYPSMLISRYTFYDK